MQTSQREEFPLREVQSHEDLTFGETVTLLTERHFLVWTAGHRIGGVLAWGCLRVSDAERLIAILSAVAHTPDRHPLGVIIDFSQVGRAGPELFAPFARYTRTISPHLKTLNVRHAVIPPGGWVGAMIAGFHKVVPHPFDVRVFHNPQESLQWLDATPLIPGYEKLMARQQTLQKEQSMEQRLMSLFQGSNAVLSVNDAAQALHTSPRQLQRALKQEDTSYRQVRQAFLLETAQHLLSETDQSVAGIAEALGFSSPKHFGNWFRQYVGISPGDWREEPHDPS